LQVPTAQAPAVQVPVPFATEHTCPHVPQLLASVSRLVEHVVPVQAPRPGPHDTAPHIEFWQNGVPLVAGHTWPHVPQLAASVVVAVSQPSATSPSQLEKPVAQLSTQAPAWHDEVAFLVLHTVPHMPQFFASVWRFVSHPSAGVLLQSAKPALQESMAHMPIEHLAVAFGRLHGVLHPPQCCASVFLSTSHPFSALPSQSAKPIAHVSMMQDPFVHTLVAWASMQAFMHEPQLLTSPSTSTSHPLAEMPSQFPKPAMQPATTHIPLVQVALACKSEQVFPHIPQLSGLLASSTSQPFAESPSQSP
jgi:hypothetical protein